MLSCQPSAVSYKEKEEQDEKEKKDEQDNFRLYLSPQMLKFRIE